MENETELNRNRTMKFGEGLGVPQSLPRPKPKTPLRSTSQQMLVDLFDFGSEVASGSIFNT